MRPLLNTLFVTTQGSYLSRDGLTVSISVEREVRARVPIHTLNSIVCFGVVTCSPFVLQLASENGVSLVHLTEHGRFIARMQGRTQGNVLLRRTQFRTADDMSASARIARSILIGKVSNARTVLQRGARESESEVARERLEHAALRLARLMPDLARADDLDTLRGFEGDAAAIYFGAFDALIADPSDAFRFTGRSRRPPLDNVNALLSFLYALLASDVAAALETVGLDPQVGFLHRDRPGRASLALDLMEELRAPVADRVALSLINRRQVRSSGFERGDTGGITMADATRKAVLAEWQSRKTEEIRHPFLNEVVPIGLLPYVQSLLLARYLRGDLDGYPPMLWK
ncbi:MULTISPECIES: type I-C CRISPR-associated endonuclease Cas1c [Acidobacterium]|uniref:CRISPR-associated endonuclease Cas1 n=1 Tax=Acidobacterium capsulatum (strain ATCC 51196 / DSM 11244 / BCRC 80197 / JCM 7670 / NBRC 15755 / NCIMB 13165 / 161) TaxID=240015 RepID=C1F2B5_ACIC5|nr:MULTISPECIES: type I-C CRISPR-associated endonuclease Cas1c [Acidobacterium]ACO31466.1 CRISPR-associated protein Cas1 [Acidobacterium capsulatum ATCC 51196]HCT60030.1 type I-C CRISPR-associated endonuclease Cas1 [Acidobacterium sp.]